MPRAVENRNEKTRNPEPDFVAFFQSASRMARKKKTGRKTLAFAITRSIDFQVLPQAPKRSKNGKCVVFWFLRVPRVAFGEVLAHFASAPAGALRAGRAPSGGARLLAYEEPLLSLIHI